MEESVINIGVGMRVSYYSNHGTVRYVGSLTSSAGSWLGIEWDEASRGRHDGSHNGTKYFSTSSPTGGSFIRPKKVDTGVAFFDALIGRYGKVEDVDRVVNNKNDMFVVGDNKKVVTVTMVGASKINDKQSQLDKLSEVSLSGLNVSCCQSPSSDIQNNCNNIMILDLSNTLLSAWTMVATLVEQLPKLHVLNLSDNRLELPHNPVSLSFKFSNLSNLYLNRVGYDWSQVLLCGLMLPGLTALHVCYNNIKTISSIDSRCFQRLETFNLSGNELVDWNYVVALGQLPCLQYLILQECSLGNIIIPTTESFSTLTSLSLSTNNISEWSDVNELFKVKNLTELKLSKNPVTQSSAMSPETIRQLLVAKLPKLQLLNGSMVAHGERHGAEIDYLKRFGVEWLRAGGNRDPGMTQASVEFLREHPRYNDLITKFGAPEDGELEVKSSALKNALISVTELSGARDPLDDIKHVEFYDMDIADTIEIDGLSEVESEDRESNDDDRTPGGKTGDGGKKCPSGGRQRQYYSPSFKVEVCRFARQATNQQAAIKYELPMKQIRYWRSSMDEFLKHGAEFNDDFRAEPSTSQGGNDSSGRKISSYTNGYKLQVVEYAKQHNNSQAAKAFHVDPKQVRDWTRREDELRAADTDSKRLRKGGRLPVYSDLEYLLVSWLDTELDQGHVHSHRHIQTQAESLATQMGYAQFKASNGWMRKFRQRHRLKFPYNYPSPEEKGKGEAEEEGGLRSSTDFKKDHRYSFARSSSRTHTDLHSHKGQTLNSYTVEFKLRVVAESRKSSVCRTARLFNISTKQVRDWTRKQDELSAASSGSRRLPGAGRKTRYPDIELLLLTWANSAAKQDDGITLRDLHSEAKRFAEKMGHDTVGFSHCWLNAFIKRHNLRGYIRDGRKPPNRRDKNYLNDTAAATTFVLDPHDELEVALPIGVNIDL